MPYDNQLKFAANVSTMFRACDFDKRFLAAKAAGFDAVEVQYPYALSPSQLAELIRDAGVQLILMNAPAGNSTKGERGLGCLPERVDDFREGIAQALAYAKAAGCGKLHVLSGVPGEGVGKHQAYATLTDNLRWAADVCGAAQITVLVEALNSKDVPGYLFHTNAAAAHIVETVNHDFCKLLFDSYHCWAEGGDVLAEFDQFEHFIGHVQIADWPGRGAPGTGNGDWQALWDRLKRSQYSDFIGCEYLA